MQYHLAKHKETNTDHRSSATENGGSSSSPSAVNAPAAIMKQRYMNPPMDHQPQHPMYPGHPPPGGPMMHNNPGNEEINE